ncbi:hypothetical protein [Pedobacter sp. CAN_A7]|uniref:hypothetical protein n=1 Tax=Pedobacter sp. CAN_A7 TaxID=2787722 RepID=UPI0018C99CE7
MTQLKALVQESMVAEQVAALTAPLVKKRLLEITQISDGLFQAIREEVFSQETDQLVKRHLQQTQYECLLLLNLLEQQEHSNCPLQIAMVNLLVAVLAYLETHHCQFFCLKAQVPNRQLKQVLLEMEDQMKLLSTGFKRKSVDLPLQELMLKCFNAFLKSGKASYESLVYMKHMQLSLINLCRDVQAEDFTRIVMEHLLYLRFNAASYEGYYKSRLLENLDKVYNGNDKFELLYHLEKVIKGQQERGAASFDPQSPSLVAVLSSFIKAEIRYLQKKQGIALLGQPPLTKKGLIATPQLPEYRIKVSLSADALAYLLRLLIEAEVIIACPRSELLLFIARHFQTPGIGNAYLSANSLGSKYRQVVQSTAKNVNAALGRMQRIVGKEFNLQ